MRSITALALAGAVCLAADAAAQSADKNTAGPTANQLQLRLAEPTEGATITGNQIRVTVSYDTRAFGMGQGTRFGEPNFPHPIFDIYLDNELQQSLKGGESNVAYVENVPPGDHKIAVVAKNISGEVIDRKEVSVRAVEGSAAALRPETGAPEPPAAPAAPAPEEAAQETTAAPASAEPRGTEPETLPATASPYPALALAGLVLLLTGLAARKA